MNHVSYEKEKIWKGLDGGGLREQNMKTAYSSGLGIRLDVWASEILYIN
jgi:hypothetical protein